MQPHKTKILTKIERCQLELNRLYNAVKYTSYTAKVEPTEALDTCDIVCERLEELLVHTMKLAGGSLEEWELTFGKSE